VMMREAQGASLGSASRGTPTPLGVPRVGASVRARRCALCSVRVFIYI